MKERIEQGIAGIMDYIKQPDATDENIKSMLEHTIKGLFREAYKQLEMDVAEKRNDL